MIKNEVNDHEHYDRHSEYPAQQIFPQVILLKPAVPLGGKNPAHHWHYATALCGTASPGNARSRRTQYPAALPFNAIADESHQQDARRCVRWRISRLAGRPNTVLASMSSPRERSIGAVRT